MVKPKKDKVATEKFVWDLHNVLFEFVEDKFENVDEKFEKVERKLDKIVEIVTDIAGKFKTFDEEQTILLHTSSKHADRLFDLDVEVFESARA